MYTEEEKEKEEIKLERAIKKVPQLSSKELENRFSYHKSKNNETAASHQYIRDLCLGIATEINRIVPEGREKALAITHLEEVMFWANAGIARNG